MGHVDVRNGLSATDWLRRQRQQNYLIGFLAVLAAAVSVATISMVQTSNIQRSSAELIKILDKRADDIQAIFDKLLTTEYGPTLEADAVKPLLHTFQTIEDDEFIARVKQIRAETNDLIQKRRTALEAGELILAHDLGNDLNKIAEKVNELKVNSASTIRILEDLRLSLAMGCSMCSFPHEELKTEKSRLRNLSELSEAYVLGED
jgi:hypothetical protein